MENLKKVMTENEIKHKELLNIINKLDNIINDLNKIVKR